MWVNRLLSLLSGFEFYLRGLCEETSSRFTSTSEKISDRHARLNSRPRNFCVCALKKKQNKTNTRIYDHLPSRNDGSRAPSYLTSSGIYRSDISGGRAMYARALIIISRAFSITSLLKGNLFSRLDSAFALTFFFRASLVDARKLIAERSSIFCVCRTTFVAATKRGIISYK